MAQQPEGTSRTSALSRRQHAPKCGNAKQPNAGLSSWTRTQLPSTRWPTSTARRTSGWTTRRTSGWRRRPAATQVKVGTRGPKQRPQRSGRWGVRVWVPSFRRRSEDGIPHDGASTSRRGQAKPGAGTPGAEAPRHGSAWSNGWWGTGRRRVRAKQRTTSPASTRSASRTPSTHWRVPRGPK